MRLYLDLRWNLWSAKRAYRKAQRAEENFAAKIADFKAKLETRPASREMTAILRQMDSVDRQLLAGLTMFERKIDLMQKTLEALCA